MFHPDRRSAGIIAIRTPNTTTRAAIARYRNPYRITIHQRICITATIASTAVVACVYRAESALGEVAWRDERVSEEREDKD
jgi:hypothetical protein